MHLFRNRAVVPSWIVLTVPPLQTIHIEAEHCPSPAGCCGFAGGAEAESVNSLHDRFRDLEAKEIFPLLDRLPELCLFPAQHCCHFRVFSRIDECRALANAVAFGCVKAKMHNLAVGEVDVHIALGV